MNGNRTSDRYAHENRDGHIHTTSNYPPPCSNLNVLPQHWIIGYDGTNELLCQIARASPWSYTDILLVQFIQLNKVRVLLSIVQDESMNLATDTDINIIVVMLIEHCPGPVYSFKTFRRLRLRWLYSLLEPLLPVIAVATTFLSFCTSFYGVCVPPPPPHCWHWFRWQGVFHDLLPPVGSCWPLWLAMFPFLWLRAQQQWKQALPTHGKTAP